MIHPLVQMGLAASWRGGATGRRRSLALAACAFAVTVVACGSLGVHHASARMMARASVRTFSPAPAGTSPSVKRSALFDETADGRQVFVYWWHRVDPSVRIPGIGGEPGTDEWFVSPGLRSAMETEPVLADRYPDASLIGADGVSSPQELLAYRFVGPGVPLDELLVARPSDDWIGDIGDAVEPFPLAVATVGLVGIPGLGLILAGASPMLAASERRLVALTALGAPGRVRRATCALPVALAAAPGAVGGGATWLIVGRSLTIVPLVGRRVFPGDLAISAADALLAAGGVVALGAILAMGSRRASVRFGSRPTALAPGSPPALRLMPLLASVGLAVASVFVPGRRGAELFLVGLVGASIGTVIGLPWLVHRVGGAIARSGRALDTLVGRRLAWDAVASTRSLLAIGALATLVPVVAAWVAVNRSIDHPETGTAYAVEVHGRMRGTEREHLASVSGAVPIEISAGDQRTAPVISLIGNCERLEPTHLARCDPSGALVPVPGHGLDDLAGLPIREVRPADEATLSTRFVATNGLRTERILRRWVVNGERPGLQVHVPGRSLFRESPLVGWLLGATRLAAAIGGIALGFHLLGVSTRRATGRGRLLALGCDPGSLATIVGIETALVLAITGGASLAVGAFASGLFVLRDPVASYPIGAVALIGAGVAAVAVGAGAAAGATAAGTAATLDRRA